MLGSEFVKALPASPAKREEAIVSAVREGHVAPIDWREIHSEHEGRRAILWVSGDALRIGDASDSVRVSVTARSAQVIADILGCILPTTRICDLIWEQATVRVPPCSQKLPPADPRPIACGTRVLQHHERVEEKVGGGKGLIENVGKYWVLSNRLAGDPSKAANYGWFDAAGGARFASGPSPQTKPGKHRLFQPLGMAHGIDHVDYAQVVRLVRRWAMIDGVRRDLVEVLQDRELAALVSDEEPPCLARLPAVPPPP
jgi:hypothetical protein